jgi:hypothetical protein
LINNPEQWLINTSAIRHVCEKKRMFFIYKKVDERNLYMRNSSTYGGVLGVEKVILKMTSI